MKHNLNFWSLQDGFFSEFMSCFIPVSCTSLSERSRAVRRECSRPSPQLLNVKLHLSNLKKREKNGNFWLLTKTWPKMQQLAKHGSRYILIWRSPTKFVYYTALYTLCSCHQFHWCVTHEGYFKNIWVAFAQLWQIWRGFDECTRTTL